MEQYILKSTLVAEIAKRIENCAKQREDMLNAQCYTLADDASARMGELNCIQNFLDTIETKELPSLPSLPDLDEAAKDYARCYTESDNGNGGDDWEDDISIAFTAGAQWLAEKGVTMSIDDNTEWADVDTFVHRNVDNKTVIQIRHIINKLKML